MAIVPPRDVLVATDFSEGADTAVRTAHAYARALGARLHVLHVTWPEEIGVTELFATLKASLGDAVPVDVAARHGDPAEEIVRYARSHAVDLIVVGTHGRSGVSRAVLGSVAERVARHAPCPVLTVPAGAAAPAPAEAEAPAAAAAPRCVVCRQESRDLICAACRARIRGEALEARRREERAGRI